MKHTAKQRIANRHRRVRAKVTGTETRPRLALSRSSRYLQVQIIDDKKGTTLVGLSDMMMKIKGTKQDRARALGTLMAEKAKAKGISKVVFDRGGYQYHGRVRAFADAARAGGLEF